MGTKTVDDVPSETALFTALRRTIAHKEYNNENFGPDYLAEIFLPASYRFLLRFAKIRDNTKNKLAQAMPGVNEHIIARTAFFDGLFQDALKNQIPQIVMLGAGYDSRAYRFTKSNKGTKFFELDAPPTQDRKIKCLKAAHINIPNEVHFVPINFINQSLSNVLEEAGYKNQEQTLFIWEGVSYYLGWNSARGTLDFVSRSSNRDSVIAFDYMISLSEENMKATYGAAELMNSMKQHHVGEELLFSIKQGQIESFLAEMNLSVIEHMDHKAIEQKYLMDDNGSLIGKMAGSFCFVCASPEKS